MQKIIRNGRIVQTLQLASLAIQLNNGKYVSVLENYLLSFINESGEQSLSLQESNADAYTSRAPIHIRI